MLTETSLTCYTRSTHPINQSDAAQGVLSFINGKHILELAALMRLRRSSSSNVHSERWKSKHGKVLVNIQDRKCRKPLQKADPAQRRDDLVPPPLLPCALASVPSGLRQGLYTTKGTRCEFSGGMHAHLQG